MTRFREHRGSLAESMENVINSVIVAVKPNEQILSLDPEPVEVFLPGDHPRVRPGRIHGWANVMTNDEQQRLILVCGSLIGTLVTLKAYVGQDAIAVIDDRLAFVNPIIQEIFYPEVKPE